MKIVISKFYEFRHLNKTRCESEGVANNVLSVNHFDLKLILEVSVPLARCIKMITEGEIILNMSNDSKQINMSQYKKSSYLSYTNRL